MSSKRKFLLGLAALATLPLAGTRKARAATNGDADPQIDALMRRVQQLEDMDAIKKLQAKYLHYLFTQDFSKVFPECFSQTRDDISVEFSDSGVYKGRESVEELYDAFNQTREVPGFFIMHMAANPYIEIAGDGQSAKSHWLSPGATGNQNGAGWVFGPYYIDYVKEGDEWRLLHTNLVPVVRTDFETSWAKATDNGTVRTLSVKPDAPSTLYRPYAEVKSEKDIFRNHPDLPKPY